jgi:hypothetical protein
LSYSWGPAVFSEHILVDDKHLPVTPNLLAALKALAQDQPRLLWIDAICINQNDLVEKGFQIPLMTEIYRSAKQALVWLGEETEDTRVVFDWIPKINEQIKLILGQEDLTYEVKVQRCQDIFEHHNSMTAVTTLFEKDWFRRLWVVQEAVVARSILFVCGSLSIRYDTLVPFAVTLGITECPHCLLSRKARLGRRFLQQLDEIRHENHSTSDVNHSSRSSLIDMIVETAFRKCFDPRDRLYALAGLVSDPTCLPYGADYEKGAAEVYTDFAAHRIGQHGWSQVLAYCYLHPDRMDGLASWAPDWTQPLIGPFSRAHDPLCTDLYHSSGHASEIRQSPIFIRYSEPPAVILYGASVDTIKVVWPLPFNLTINDPRDDSITNPDFQGHIGPTLEKLLLFCGPLSENPIPWSILWRVLIRDISFPSVSTRYLPRAAATEEQYVQIAVDALIYDSQIAQFQHHKDFGPMVDSSGKKMSEPEFGAPLVNFQMGQELPHPANEQVKTRKLHAAKAQKTWQKLKGVIRRFRWPRQSPPIPHPVAHSDIRHVVNMNLCINLMSTFRHRSFCVTESGRCGWIPDVSIPGDVIAVFAGHDVPMVLRDCENSSCKVIGDYDYEYQTYKVVGDSYIHRIMDGEAVEGKGAAAFNRIRLI